MAHAYDIGSQLVPVGSYRLVLTSHAAGITTASTESMGKEIDLWQYKNHFASCQSIVALDFVGATTQTPACTVTLRMEDADTSGSTSFVAYTTAVSKVVGCTSELAATNYIDTISQDVNLSGASRWIRQVVTVINTATCSSDTITAVGCLAFGGASILPPTTST
jgi:hypothetical protein